MFRGGGAATAAETVREVDRDRLVAMFILPRSAFWLVLLDLRSTRRPSCTELRTHADQANDPWPPIVPIAE